MSGALFMNQERDGRAVGRPLFCRYARTIRYLHGGGSAALSIDNLDADCAACREPPVSVRLPIDLKATEAKERLGERRHRRGAPVNGSQE
jgi:hypothetical protein